MKSMSSSGKFEEMVSELEGCRWDAILWSETWRDEQAEIMGNPSQTHFMGSGKFGNKHGV